MRKRSSPCKRNVPSCDQKHYEREKIEIFRKQIFLVKMSHHENFPRKNRKELTRSDQLASCRPVKFIERDQLSF